MYLPHTFLSTLQLKSLLKFSNKSGNETYGHGDAFCAMKSYNLFAHLYNDNNGACQEHREADRLPHMNSILLPKACKEGAVDIHGES
jgi:hypothetical protein